MLKNGIEVGKILQGVHEISRFKGKFDVIFREKKKQKKRAVL